MSPGKTPSSATAQTVLVIEDDVDVSRLLGKFLKSLGLKPHFASNGNEALPLIEKLSPDLIILDIYMPRKDGMSLLKEIRGQYPEGLPFGVILVTGCMDERLLQEALQLGAGDVVPKPIQFMHLELSVRTQLLLQRHSQGVQASAERGTTPCYKGHRITPRSYQVSPGQWMPQAEIALDGTSGGAAGSVSGTLPYTDRGLADAAAIIIAKGWIDAHGATS